LRCSFCWQDHENKIGIDTVIEKLVPIEEFLKTEKRNSVVFNAMGGEVFATEIFDLIEASWHENSYENGKLKVCAMKCGVEFDPFEEQFK
jgi:hypothetical protein